MMVILSFVILVALIVARSFSVRSKAWHVKMMSLVVISDISLVLFLAMGRNVLSKIDHNISGLLIFHIALAISVVIGYIFAAIWGIKLSRGEEKYRPFMKTLDRIIVPARTLVFATALLLKVL